jgi:hypothetical protein
VAVIGVREESMPQEGLTMPQVASRPPPVPAVLLGADRPGTALPRRPAPLPLAPYLLGRWSRA